VSRFLVLWDVDFTLVDTRGAGADAVLADLTDTEQPVAAVLGADLDAYQPRPA
jgi:phosphoglycolate phosphatase-like HAD superfamily hydrolase